MSWRDYIRKITDEDRLNLLDTILQNEEDTGCSQYRYREGDEETEECIYWEGSGEPLITEAFNREDWIIAAEGDFGKVFDAEGNEIEHVTSANMKTGWCEFMKSENGVFALDDNGEIKKFVEEFPAPLKFVREER